MRVPALRLWRFLVVVTISESGASASSTGAGGCPARRLRAGLLFAPPPCLKGGTGEEGSVGASGLASLTAYAIGEKYSQEGSESTIPESSVGHY